MYAGCLSLRDANSSISKETSSPKNALHRIKSEISSKDHIPQRGLHQSATPFFCGAELDLLKLTHSRSLSEVNTTCFMWRRHRIFKITLCHLMVMAQRGIRSWHLANLNHSDSLNFNVENLLFPAGHVPSWEVALALNNFGDDEFHIGWHLIIILCVAYWNILQ